MATNIERASFVARHVDLESVTLRSVTASMNIDPADAPQEIRLNLLFRGNYGLRDSNPNRLYVTVDLKFSAMAGSEDESYGVADIDGSYFLVYELDNAATFPPDALDHFADLNGAYNAWPYWRQLVQAMTSDMGLTGVTIPVFRPPVSEAAREAVARGVEREKVNS